MMLLSSVMLLLFIHKGDLYNQSLLENERKSRFFGWGGWGWGIGIVRFENKYCQSSEGIDGTCYTRRQCRELDGTSAGLCASTFAYCCIIQRNCGSTSSYNNTYFVNPGAPATVTGASSCTYIIQKCNSDICQVRIDFLSFSLAPPNSMGHCTYDSLRITGGASFIQPICGENTGQHIYLGFRGDADIILSITTTGGYSKARTWKLKVAQIGCDCATKAPDGCLMYYTTRTGTVTSFNYAQATTNEYYNVTNVNFGRLPGTRELANLNYGVCIRMDPGYCSIQWSQSSAGSFAVSGSTPGGATVIDGCYTDYVLVPNPVPPNMVTTDRFCGNTFPTVTSFSKPFVIYVVTDDVEQYSQDAQPNDIGNLGFSLDYRQIPCNPLTMA